MQPAPIRNKPLFYVLTAISFGLLALAVVTLTSGSGPIGALFEYMQGGQRGVS